MSELYFDGWEHKLTYSTKDGSPIGGGWYANNVVDRSIKNLRFLPNGVYQFLDKHFPYMGTAGPSDSHGIAVDSVNGAFGRFGISRPRCRFPHNGYHAGVGIHSGRADKGGADHATHGCIRTTDDVMEALVYYIMNDPLTTLTVINNHDQHDKLPPHGGDAHFEFASRLA